MVFILASCIAYNCAANQRRDADETQRQVTTKSLRIAEEQKECKKLEELARADLATVEPALNEAMKVCRIIESFFYICPALNNFCDRFPL